LGYYTEEIEARGGGVPNTLQESTCTSVECEGLIFGKVVGDVNRLVPENLLPFQFFWKHGIKSRTISLDLW
jgi:hypothetical protein